MASPAKVVRIALDAMGGDFGAEVNVQGALQAIEQAPELHLTLIGDSQAIQAELNKAGTPRSAQLSILHTSETITMEDHAASTIRRKKDSSIHVGLNLLQRQEVDAFLSAGNSGAVMAGALLLVGRLHDIERPAIIVKLPTAEGFVTILDVGANVDCKAQHLVDFAEMGTVFAQVLEGITSPRVALLSNGAETHKGNELTRQADTLFRGRKSLNYVGYLEGNDLFRDRADVIVCDGFVGNICLKLAEGLADTTFKWFRRQLHRDWLGIIGVFLMRNLLRQFKSKFDYQPYGAAPLLGIAGLVFISHGSSTPKAIRNGLLTAKHAIEQRFMEQIKEHLQRVRRDKDDGETVKGT